MFQVTSTQLVQIHDHKNPIIRHIYRSNLIEVIGVQRIELSEKYESAEKLIELAQDWAKFAVENKSVASFELALNFMKAAGEMTLSSYGEWEGDFVVSRARINRIRFEIVLACVNAGITRRSLDGAL